MPTAKPTPSAYQLKITLLKIGPPIRRRIQLPSTLLLCCRHDAVQAVMGWTACHLMRLRTIPSALLVNVGAHQKMLEDRSAMRNSWRPSASLDTRNSAISVDGLVGSFTPKSFA